MNTPFPSSSEEVRAALSTLTTRQIGRLADLSQSSEPTIIKIRYGQIANPGIDTVARFWPHIEQARAEPSRVVVPA